ncbi:hypothetical protein Tco_0503737 [Tanacetum coccineum]
MVPAAPAQLFNLMTAMPPTESPSPVLEDADVAPEPIPPTSKPAPPPGNETTAVPPPQGASPSGQPPKVVSGLMFSLFAIVATALLKQLRARGMATSHPRHIRSGFAMELDTIPSGLATSNLLISRHADESNKDKQKVIAVATLSKHYILKPINMMSDSSGGGLSDLDDIDDLEIIMQEVQSEQEQEAAAERVCHQNYIYRERLDAEERLMADYFGPNPKCPLYYSKTVSYEPVRPDATGLPGFSVVMKCTSAIRQLAYGVTPDALDEYLQMACSSCLDLANAFVNGSAGLSSDLKATALSLSQNISMGSCTVGTTPRSPMKFFIQIASFEASQANVVMSNNGTNVTLPTYATVTPTITGPNIASNVPTTPHAFYASPGHLTPPAAGLVHTTIGSVLSSGVVNTSGQATLLPQAFTVGTLHDPTTGAWNIDTDRMDGKWMKCIMLKCYKMEQRTLSKARRGAYIGPIGRPMGYDGLPMGLGPD